MMYYAQLGETDWLLYYKKHRKMSESTFVQSQLMHLSRVVVYPAAGRVRIMVSPHSLADGILSTLHNVSHVASLSRANLPDFVVVLSVRPSATIDFCVLALEPLQVRMVCELHQLMALEGRLRKWGRKGGGGGEGIGTKEKAITEGYRGLELKIEKEVLVTMRSFQRKLGGERFCSVPVFQFRFQWSACDGTGTKRSPPHEPTQRGRPGPIRVPRH